MQFASANEPADPAVTPNLDPVASPEAGEELDVPTELSEGEEELVVPTELSEGAQELGVPAEPSQSLPGEGVETTHAEPTGQAWDEGHADPDVTAGGEDEDWRFLPQPDEVGREDPGDRSNSVGPSQTAAPRAQGAASEPEFHAPRATPPEAAMQGAAFWRSPQPSAMAPTPPWWVRPPPQFALHQPVHAPYWSASHQGLPLHPLGTAPFAGTPPLAPMRGDDCSGEYQRMMTAMAQARRAMEEFEHLRHAFESRRAEYGRGLGASPGPGAHRDVKTEFDSGRTTSGGPIEPERPKSWRPHPCTIIADGIRRRDADRAMERARSVQRNADGYNLANLEKISSAVQLSDRSRQTSSTGVPDVKSEVFGVLARATEALVYATSSDVKDAAALRKGVKGFLDVVKHPLAPELLLHRDDGRLDWQPNIKHVFDSLMQLGPKELQARHPAIAEAVRRDVDLWTAFNAVHGHDVEGAELCVEFGVGERNRPPLAPLRLAHALGMLSVAQLDYLEGRFHAECQGLSYLLKMLQGTSAGASLGARWVDYAQRCKDSINQHWLTWATDTKAVDLLYGRGSNRDALARTLRAPCLWRHAVALLLSSVPGRIASSGDAEQWHRLLLELNMFEVKLGEGGGICDRLAGVMQKLDSMAAGSERHTQLVNAAASQSLTVWRILEKIELNYEWARHGGHITVAGKDGESITLPGVDGNSFNNHIYWKEWLDEHAAPLKKESATVRELIYRLGFATHIPDTIAKVLAKPRHDGISHGARVKRVDASAIASDESIKMYGAHVKEFRGAGENVGQTVLVGISADRLRGGVVDTSKPMITDSPEIFDGLDDALRRKLLFRKGNVWAPDLVPFILDGRITNVLPAVGAGRGFPRVIVIPCPEQVDPDDWDKWCGKLRTAAGKKQSTRSARAAMHKRRDAEPSHGAERRQAHRMVHSEETQRARKSEGPSGDPVSQTESNGAATGGTSRAHHRKTQRAAGAEPTVTIKRVKVAAASATDVEYSIAGLPPQLMQGLGGGVIQLGGVKSMLTVNDDASAPGSSDHGVGPSTKFVATGPGRRGGRRN